MTGFKRVKPGDPIKASTINELLDFARTQSLKKERGVDVERDWVDCVSLNNVDPFGVVEVYDAAWVDGIVRFNVRTPTSLNPKVLATNGEFNLVASAKGWVRVINPYGVYRVRSSGSLTFGAWIGVANGNSHVTASKCGRLITLSPNHADNYTLVTHRKEPANFLCKTSSIFLKGAVSSQSVCDDTGVTNGETVTVNNHFGDIPSGKLFAVEEFETGFKVIAADAC